MSAHAHIRTYTDKRQRETDKQTGSLPCPKVVRSTNKQKKVNSAFYLLSIQQINRPQNDCPEKGPDN